MNKTEIDNLIKQTDIVSLVSKYVKLEKQGKNYKGLCPFHNEKSPSFFVSPEKNLFNCFGCHTIGGPIEFIKKIENVEFPEALRMLCEFNGVKYTNSNYKPDPNEIYYKIMGTAKEFYNKFLLNDVSSTNALNYLKSRGITDEIINDFEIGLAPNNYDTIYKLLTDMNYLEYDIADCGLIDMGDNNKYHDLFVNRIMFPIKDERNNTLGFSARIYIKDPNQPKYINSRDTKIYRKGQVLFNLNLAKSAITKKNRIILHEGQMDVIASYKSDLKEAICSLGTAIGDNQVKLISKYTKNIIIAFDGDKAGIDSSKKTINLFKKYGFNVHLVLLPDGKDPDEYVAMYGTDSYREYFENNIIDEVEYLYRVTLLNKNLNDKNEFNKVKKEIFNIIHSLNSQIEEEKYLRRFSEFLNSSYDAVLNDYNKLVNNKNHGEVNIVRPINLKKDFNREIELRLIYYGMKSKKKALMIDNEIRNALDVFSSGSQSLWISLVYSYYEDHDEFDEKVFLNGISDEAFKQYTILNEVLGKSINKDFNDEDLNSCIEKIKDMKAEMKNMILHEKNLTIDDDTERSRNLDMMFKNKKSREKHKNN